MVDFFKRVFIIMAILMAMSCLCTKYNNLTSTDYNYDVHNGEPLSK